MTLRAALLLWLALCANASAEPVRVRVIELAGELAYLEPGRAAGLAPGVEVRFGERRVVVSEATEHTAAVRLGELHLAVGDLGTAEVTHAAAASPRLSAQPRPAAHWTGQWPEPVRPAAAQHPPAVALGFRPSGGRYHLTVHGWALAAGDRDQQTASGEARVVARYQAAVGLELDVAARAYSAGLGAAHQPAVLVRAAELRWGPREAPRLLAGRLRYAATSVGMLDGARASVQRGALALAAFGGMVPDPQSGRPSAQAARFGAELTYRLERAAWQPQVVVSAHGSSWDGALDERKLSAQVSAGREHTWLDGWAEAQAFDAQNPWAAARLEVVGAGAAARVRTATYHAGVDLSFLRPDRSAHLLAVLPLELGCVPAVEIGDTATRCAAGQWWSTAAASGGLQRGPWALDAIASVGYERGQATGTTRSLALRGERAWRALRLDAELGASKTRFASFTGGALGARYALTPRAELGARYRPELVDYSAGTGPTLGHAVLAEARLSPWPSLDLATSALAQYRAGREALALWLALTWRPWP